MFGRSRKIRQTSAAAALYAATVARAREPFFFITGGVVDSVDGRFDVLTLHAFLVLDALERGGGEMRGLAEGFTTLLFTGLEEALREMGVGDMGLARRMKAMANAFYGRLETYRAADDAALADALERNLYRGAVNRRAEALGIANYMRLAQAYLSQPEQAAALRTGAVDFGPLPILQA